MISYQFIFNIIQHHWLYYFSYIKNIAIQSQIHSLQSKFNFAELQLLFRFSILNTMEQAENDQKVPDSQVITYQAPWIIYAMGFSAKNYYPYRLGIASFLEETKNQVEIIQLNLDTQLFETKAKFQHNYPPTKLIWIPDKEGSKSDLLATSGQHLKIWEVLDNKQVRTKCDLINENQFSAPLTSFDWNPNALNLIGTCSIDTTCTIWDIQKGTVYTQLIAHDKQVYDINFSKEKDIFASVGADGSVRQFDLRNLQHSTVLYQTEQSLPLLKLAWNRIDSNYLAVIQMDMHHITLLDVRKPLLSFGKLKNHKDCVNSLCWAPQSSSHLCSVGDDSQAFIWDLQSFKQQNYFPFLEYKAQDQISNLTWSTSQPEWLSICFRQSLQILRL